MIKTNMAGNRGKGIRSGRLAAWTLVCAGLWLTGCSKIEPPASYATYTNKSGRYRVEYPEGWNADGGGGKSNDHWAKFTKGSAQFSAHSDLSGSLMGDMGSAGGLLGGDLGQPSEEDMPVHRIHMMPHKVGEEFSDYKETGSPVKFTNQFAGEGRKSEFTASGIHGYRATFLSRDRRFTVVCQGKESDWAVLKPIYDHMLESFKTGGD